LKFVRRKRKYGFGDLSRIFEPFFNFSLQHFQFSVALGPFLGPFLAFIRPLFDFFHLAHAYGISLSEKGKKAAYFRPKKFKNRSQVTENWKCFRLAVEKNAPKNSTHPQNHIYVPLYFSSNKFQRYIPTHSVGIKIDIQPLH